MKVTATERDDFAVGRAIGGLGAKVAMPGGTTALLQMLQQQRLLVSKTHDKDCFAMFQRLIDARKEGRIALDLAGAYRIGLVMQMRRCQVGMNGPPADGMQAQGENLGDAVIDPDDGVVVHGQIFIFVKERIEITLMRHQNWYRHRFEHAPCDAAKNSLLQSRMAVSAHHQQAHITFGCDR